MNFDTKQEEVKAFVKERFCRKFPDSDVLKTFEKKWEAYVRLPEFKINENIFQVLKSDAGLFKNLDVEFDEQVLFIVRMVTQYYLTCTFKAMKIDLSDPNVFEELSDGNIGTPGRIAKMWTAANLEDSDELMCGRWTKPPRMATFPNNSERKVPITKRVTLNSVCSHHAAIFSSQWSEDSYAIISYIPDEFVCGISKLQRIVDWIGRRGWLQEDLTHELFKYVSESVKTRNVYVKLVNIIHSCELNRGSKGPQGGFTTEYYDGLFNNPEYREMVNKDY